MIREAGGQQDSQATPTTSDDGAASDRYVITVVGQLLPYYRTKLFISRRREKVWLHHPTESATRDTPRLEMRAEKGAKKKEEKDGARGHFSPAGNRTRIFRLLSEYATVAPPGMRMDGDHRVSERNFLASFISNQW